jgi:hypothetical protein
MSGRAAGPDNRPRERDDDPRSASRAACAVIVFAWTAFSCLAGTVRAQDRPDQIEPDRPDVTNGTHIVDIGLLQIEFGGLYTHAGPRQHAFGSPLTARVGVTEWLEARVGTDGFLTASDGITRQTGIGNTQLAAKLRLWADPGGVPVLSVLPAINFPTADPAKGFGTGDRDYMVTLLTGSDVARHWHIDGNYGIGRIGAGGGQPHFTQHLASISVSAAATDNVNPYVEAFWLSRPDPDSRAILAVDGGAVYELGARYAVDGGLQLTLLGDTHDIALFGGFSAVVGDILGNHGVHARQREVRRRQGRGDRRTR